MLKNSNNYIVFILIFTIGCVSMSKNIDKNQIVSGYIVVPLNGQYNSTPIILLDISEVKTGEFKTKLILIDSLYKYNLFLTDEVCKRSKKKFDANYNISKINPDMLKDIYKTNQYILGATDDERYYWKYFRNITVGYDCNYKAWEWIFGELFILRKYNIPFNKRCTVEVLGSVSE